MLMVMLLMVIVAGERADGLRLVYEERPWLWQLLRPVGAGPTNRLASKCRSGSPGYAPPSWAPTSARWSAAGSTSRPNSSDERAVRLAGSEFFLQFRAWWARGLLAGMRFDDAPLEKWVFAPSNAPLDFSAMRPMPSAPSARIGVADFTGAPA